MSYLGSQNNFLVTSPELVSANTKADLNDFNINTNKAQLRKAVIHGKPHLAAYEGTLYDRFTEVNVGDTVFYVADGDLDEIGVGVFVLNSGNIVAFKKNS